MFERRDQPVIPVPRFVVRVTKALLVVLAIDAAAILLGLFGYHEFAGLDWLSAWQDGVMVITGNGLVVPVRTEAGRMFSTFDALIGVLVFITGAGMILAPILHRILHIFHLQTPNGGQ